MNARGRAPHGLRGPAGNSNTPCSSSAGHGSPRTVRVRADAGSLGAARFHQPVTKPEWTPALRPGIGHPPVPSGGNAKRIGPSPDRCPAQIEMVLAVRPHAEHPRTRPALSRRNRGDAKWWRNRSGHRSPIRSRLQWNCSPFEYFVAQRAVELENGKGVYRRNVSRECIGHPRGIRLITLRCWQCPRGLHLATERLPPDSQCGSALMPNFAPDRPIWSNPCRR